MRFASLVFASLLLVAGAPGAWGVDEPPGEIPATAALVPETTPVAPLDTPVAEAAGVTLGRVGYDEQGRPGRLHVVVRGDTLWDISEAYLGTPWVWPSVWQDNQDIANPHLIRPGDRIWITKDEMRRVSEEEAERLLAGSPASDVPAALEEAAPAALAPPPVLFPFHRIDAMGLVSREQVEAAASVVDSPLDRIWLAEHDTVFVGLGRGEVEEGDELTIFRTAEKVMHPQTGGFFGYYVN
ncbi:MAG: LysM peptidoglycan-binding domain-containing protein, partial [Myxococcota bacterium]